jgi:hypothetical protein
MSDTIHFVQVEGADDEILDEVNRRMELVTDDNIVVTDETIEPVSREDVKDLLQELATALDMKLIDSEDSNK